jgi:hypothetical protein
MHTNCSFQWVPTSKSACCDGCCPTSAGHCSPDVAPSTPGRWVAGSVGGRNQYTPSPTPDSWHHRSAWSCQNQVLTLTWLIRYATHFVFGKVQFDHWILCPHTINIVDVCTYLLLFQAALGAWLAAPRGMQSTAAMPLGPTLKLNLCLATTRFVEEVVAWSHCHI